MLADKLQQFLREKGVLATPDGKVLTANQTGAMVTCLSDVSKQFIQDAASFSPAQTVVDIGCCYGIVSVSILDNSQAQILAFDAEHKHIQAFNEFMALNLEHYPRLSTQVGYFPEDLNLAANSIDAIHASHLLQFLSGEKIELGLRKCYEILRPSGRIYLTSTSIYLSWIESFLPLYEKRLDRKWPGEISNFKDYASEAAKDFTSNFFHALTKEKLVKILLHVGFKVEESFYYPVANPSVHNDVAEEMVGVIAVKL